MKTQQVDLGDKGSFSVRKGALHRALGVPQGQKLSDAELSKASNSSSPKVRRMAASAKGFRAMRKGR